MGSYKEVKVIGEGAFGKAVLVKSKSTKKEYVIKKIKSELVTEKEREQTAKEVEVLKQLQHENIVSFIESFEEKGCLHIVMSYCSKGNLASKIKKQGNNRFPERKILKIFCQLCHAVEYLHKKNILHRDIKPENIFRAPHGVIKLGDFGLSKILEKPMQYAGTCAGTPLYMAPEILHLHGYKNKCDMWSLGCVLYELAELKRAFKTIPDVISGKFSPISSQYSQDLRNLITALLSMIPNKRPSAHEILSMGFVEDFMNSERQLKIRLQAIHMGILMGSSPVLRSSCIVRNSPLGKRSQCGFFPGRGDWSAYGVILRKESGLLVYPLHMGNLLMPAIGAIIGMGVQGPQFLFGSSVTRAVLGIIGQDMYIRAMLERGR